ncbi:Paraquat-inducible protein B [Vibrio aerogenes CECT 7868]|uniref:Paraquat-inducible protein B n=1 Tax=Vibrio aerogenes CECT 7868 TaxID=1216006 RepID=A0A1M5WW62_9VIBR|nr:intermembrane transport protein PqiB [Vibrio aerogenes]SHH91612.1 Paraquat-inducible protein B [Vibrio aerogenes CECT 7868]
MSDKQLQGKVKNQTQISAIWIIPVIAMLIGAWMLFQFIYSTGPEITLKMQTAEGIKVGKTEIRSLNVKVGIVTGVKLNENYDSILVTARMNKDARRMLKEDSLFWVVKPRVGSEGISGLDTLLSGAYIQLQPGRAEKEKREFTILEQPPVAPADAKGLRIVLTHELAGKLTVGDPVIYKGFTAGRVEKVTFDVARQKAFYEIFVFQPYDDLIRKNTRFWINSGLSLDMGTEGVKLHFDSIESLISGGVSFGVPEGEDPGEVVTEQRTRFRLFDDQKQMNEERYNQYIEYLMFFNESIRGLNAGAPVEYRGLRIGTVKKVPFSRARQDYDFHSTQIPVLIRIELERIYAARQTLPVERFKNMIRKEFSAGLRAELKTGSLLTGALYIGIDYNEPDKVYKPSFFEGYEIFPTKPGGFTEVQKQFTDLLKKLNHLPLDETADSLNRSLKTLEKSLASFNQATQSVQKLIDKKETQSLPAEVQASLQKIQQTLDGFSPDSTVYQDLDGALKQFEQAMVELQPVLRQIKNKPNSLVFGDEQKQDPVPAKGAKK